MRLPLWNALCATALISGCSEQSESPAQATAVNVFSCSHLLIGIETVHCREDVIGPGTLRVSVRPDPKETSWELAISGLAALAEHCEFHGQFDQTRLSALQGRGETDLICPIAADVDRQYHEIRFQNRIDAPSTAIAVTVTLTR